MEEHIRGINANEQSVMLKSEEFEKLVDDLLSVLDEDIRLVEKALSRLDEIRGFVIKRDEVSLRGLLKDIEGDRGYYVANESKRQQVRDELAAALGCSAEAVNLSKLERAQLRMPPEKRTALSEKKTKLKTLVEKLKTEHLRTAMLLSECVRLNRLLLKGIFGFDSQAVTYGADGNTKWQAGRSIVSARV